MNTHANKNAKDHNPATAESTAMGQGAASGLIDNRPESVLMRQLQHMVNNKTESLQFEDNRSAALTMSGNPQNQPVGPIQRMAGEYVIQQMPEQTGVQAPGGISLSGISEDTIQRVQVNVGDSAKEVTVEMSAGEILDAVSFNSLLGKFNNEISLSDKQKILDEIGAHKEADGALYDLIDVLKEDLEESSPEPSDNEALGNQEEFVSDEEQAEIRAAKAEAFKWGGFPDNHGGYKKLGLHETVEKNVFTLVQQGPAREKMGSGHKLGKGPGFYATHVGNRQLKTVTSEMVYDDAFTAVYINSAVEEVRSPDEASNSVQELDRDYGDRLVYYRMSGGSEIVIPTRAFPLVKVVNVADQITGLDNRQQAQKRMEQVFNLYETLLGLTAAVKKGKAFPKQSGLLQLEKEIKALGLPKNGEIMEEFTNMMNVFRAYGVIV